MVIRSKLAPEINDKLSTRSYHNKGGFIWPQSRTFRKNNYGITRLLREIKIRMRNECMWLRWGILIISAGLPHVQKEDSYVLH